jgi:hypothetical protein
LPDRGSIFESVISPCGMDATTWPAASVNSITPPFPVIAFAPSSRSGKTQLSGAPAESSTTRMSAIPAPATKRRSASGRTPAYVTVLPDASPAT